MWVTTVPTSGSDEIFLSGLAYPVTAYLPGGIKGVTWSGDLRSDAPGVSISWKWSAAVYTQFSADYNALNVKPTHTNACSITNSDHAGTPEAFKTYVIGGGRGGGGSNYTGSWSGTQSLGLICEPGGSPGQCSIVEGNATAKDRQFKWPLTNSGSAAATLTGLTLAWPQGNGRLLKIKFDGDVVWDATADWSAGGITLSTPHFATDPKKKTINSGQTRIFTLEFQNNANADLTTYTVNATFDSGCTVVFVPSLPPFGGDFCQTAPGSGRAKTLTMVFLDANGGDNTSYNCTSNCNTQDAGKVIVTGDPAPAAQAWIKAVPTGKTSILFEGPVNLDGSFVMSAASAGLSTFDTNTTVTLYTDSTKTIQLSSVQFHTSCSQPLNDGDYYGSLRLTGFSR